MAGLMLRRRAFLKGVAAGAAFLAGKPQLVGASGAYQVGVGASSTGDPYAAAQRAILASGQFPSATMAGKTVLIKPNLVKPMVASTGATTDPQVVRAVVDAALAANAASVLIIEGGVGTIPAPFAACGYSFFSTYDPRVHLMDLGTQPYSLATVPHGLTYSALYLPTVVQDPNIIFISVAKLKTHVDAVATLSMKNLVGLAVPAEYQFGSTQLPRFDLHAHGIDEAIIDLNLTRRVDYAVIDGIWGMEGAGPTKGTPVLMNLVIAGLNPVAVDRVGLSIMEIAQNAVPHLTYATLKGLGPSDLSSVSIRGDSYTPYPFTPAATPPIIWRPSVNPTTISLSAGQKATISYKLSSACSALVEIIKDSNVTPGITSVRTLQNWSSAPAGTSSVQWDGTDNNGLPVTPGTYMARVQARFSVSTTTNFATAWVNVTS